MDKSVLSRATEDNDAPTPGYLYGEIARMTQHSFETCLKVQDYLIGRLKKKQPNIKYKALQVIKHVCREGRIDFRREMQKHVPTVKECLQFRGPPDPLNGDEYYRRVREAAKECLDAIFDANSNLNAMASSGMASRIRGVGNPADFANQQQSSTWTNKLSWGSKGENPPQGGGQYPNANPNEYNPQFGQQGYNAPGGYNGPPYGDSQQNAPGYNGQQPGGYGGSYNGPPGGHNGPPGGYNGPPYPSSGMTPYGQSSQNIQGSNAFGPQGIGNPNFQDAREEKGFLQGLKEKAASKFSKSNEPKVTFAGGPPGLQNAPDGWSFATNRGPTSGSYGVNNAGTYNPEETYRPNQAQNGGGYGPPGGDPYSSNFPSNSTYNSNENDRVAASTQLRETSFAGTRKKGKVGGAWDAATVPSVPTPAPPAPAQSMNSTMNANNYNNNNEYNNNTNTNNTNRYNYNDNPPYGNTIAPPVRQNSFQNKATGQTLGAASDGSYERSIIAALCPSGGMRAVPPKDKLDAFLKNAITLDADIVGPILAEEFLADDAWQVVSKAVTVIDCLLSTSGCENFHEYFSDNAEELEICAQSDKAAIRDRAVKILRTLGRAVSSSNKADTSSSSTSNIAQRKKASNTSVDLLQGFADDDNVQRSASSESASLFHGLTSNAPASNYGNAESTSVQQTMDMFGGLQLSSGALNSNIGNSQQQTSYTQQMQQPMQGQTQQMMNQMPNQMQPMQQMQYGQQQQQMGYMQQQQQQHQMLGMQGMQGMNMQQLPGNYPGMNLDPRMVRSNSQVIGSAMTPSGYIAKTIHEPVEESKNSGFDFLQKRDDSFSFVQDALKKS